MPSKINPTQCEALIMVTLQVIGNNFIFTMIDDENEILEINIYKPIIINNILQSI